MGIVHHILYLYFKRIRYLFGQISSFQFLGYYVSAKNTYRRSFRQSNGNQDMVNDIGLWTIFLDGFYDASLGKRKKSGTLLKPFVLNSFRLFEFR